MGIWYTTRESVKDALDQKETARADGQVDRAVEAASRSVEGLLHRRFYPWTGTRYFDWPNPQRARPWRLWLDANEVISVTTLTSGGVEIDEADYFVRRADDLDEPPYDHIELDLDSSASFGGGSTHQRDVAITGVFGYGDDTAPAGALGAALDSTSTTLAVTDGGAVGVGDLLLVGSERMVVTGRAMADTGLTTTEALTASAAGVAVTVSSSTGAPQPGEVILVGSERMLVVDAAGTALTVKRAWDGSVLADHDSGAAVWAPRSLTVSRGAVGTTAASHAEGVPLARHVYPGPVATLCEAYALNTLLQARAGYARTAGEGEGARESTGRGVKAAERDAYRAFGRKARVRAV
ncbi:hypothetical protein E1281_25925 [Actinomadura sp. KC345]|uniref:hypothetical protein n=1 Tax=Actinomadura sp. KC345 TaxID=2530371 RepID=UPI001051E504|nr:hypothetical protein [Actinomadura sp. KC345]TDC47642.1 hypothetical protein E1281_25925 [Actinomadura sp. KC345]